MTEYLAAFDHELSIEACGQAYIIEGVAYSPIKTTYLCNYDDETPVYCKSCDWETTVGDLPEDAGAVQPDMCPACWKEGELGWVRGTPLNAQTEG